MAASHNFLYKVYTLKLEIHNCKKGVHFSFNFGRCCIQLDAVCSEQGGCIGVLKGQNLLSTTKIREHQQKGCVCMQGEGGGNKSIKRQICDKNPFSSNVE